MADMPVKAKTGILTPPTPPASNPPAAAPASGEGGGTTPAPQGNNGGTAPMRDSRQLTGRGSGTSQLSLPGGQKDAPSSSYSAAVGVITGMAQQAAKDHNVVDDARLGTSLANRAIQAHKLATAGGLHAPAGTTPTTTPGAQGTPPAAPSSSGLDKFKAGVGIAGGISGAYGMYANAGNLKQGFDKVTEGKVAEGLTQMAQGAIGEASGFASVADGAQTALKVGAKIAGAAENPTVIAAAEKLGDVAKLGTGKALSKVFPALGIASGLAQAANAASKTPPDTGGVIAGVATAAGSAMMMSGFPPLQAAGLALTVGAAVYDFFRSKPAS